jgi:hypothetical protein
MFVDKDRHAFAAPFENIDDFLKSLVARIEDLAKFIRPVVPVLDNEQDCVYIKLVPAQSFVDGFAELDSMRLAKRRPQVIRWRLVVEHPHHLKRRLVVKAVLAIAMHKPADNVVGMRAEAENRVHRGDSELAAGGRALFGLFSAPWPAAEETEGGRRGPRH